MAQCAAATILELFAAVFPAKGCRPNIIASTQTFGDLLVWHPHIHCLVTDGVFDLASSFHPVPGIDSDQATFIFREKVFAMMKGRERISDGLVENMRSWHHSGFSVHNEVVIQKEDREALGRLAQYVVHASFSQEKIRYIVDFAYKYPQNASMEKIASPISQGNQEMNYEIEERG